MTDEPNTAEVTQADREAAAAYHHVLRDRFTAHITDGIEDDTPLVQAFARHRLASRPDDRPTSEPSQDDIERARKFLRGLRRPTINSNVPEGVAIQAMFERCKQENTRERETSNLAGVAHAEIASEVGIHSSGDGSDSGAVRRPDSSGTDDRDRAGTLGVAAPAMPVGGDREAMVDKATRIIVSGLGLDDIDDDGLSEVAGRICAESVVAAILALHPTSATEEEA